MSKQEQNWCYTKLNAGLGTVLQSMTSSSLRTRPGTMLEFDNATRQAGNVWS